MQFLSNAGQGCPVERKVPKSGVATRLHATWRAGEVGPNLCLRLPGRVTYHKIGTTEKRTGYAVKIQGLESGGDFLISPSASMGAAGAVQCESVPGWMVKVINLKKGQRIQPDSKDYVVPSMIPGQDSVVEVAACNGLPAMSFEIKTLVLNRDFDTAGSGDDEKKGQRKEEVELTRDPFDFE
eukprot:11419713-Alexandrium_andersonii.AAC.1